ncbi:gamma carbonic anhydrase family protein [Granulicoccus phenolivorans]|uniref:gamma carbonic anhydrase family protein n=1 Tax=Granulicoccus phenolivorans TaxID=266854 RepID=UPI0003F7ABF2|nr:gamma carbonic anhydrase family protein [Granulicoccus phenolivorans]
MSTSAPGTAPFVHPIGEHTPQIDDTAFLAPGTFVTGDVRVGPEASIWYGTSVRGDTTTITLGARSNVQDNSALHADPGAPLTIGANVTIGHRAVVHGCTIEDGCLIGMGSVVMNHAVIGAGSLVAAGAVVLEGTEVPPGSLVAGMPAKVRRALTDEEQARLLRSADTYVGLADRHRQSLA